MTIAARLQVLGIELPPLAIPAAAYLPFVQTGSLVFISGLISIATRGPIREDEGPDLIPEIAGGSAQLDPTGSSRPHPRYPHRHDEHGNPV